MQPKKSHGEYESHAAGRFAACLLKGCSQGNGVYGAEAEEDANERRNAGRMSQ